MKVAVNGTVLWTATEGEGVPMVLCHGGPGGYDDMGPLSGALADIATVHRYDQRGCGRSAHTPPYTLEAYLQDLDDLRAYWGYESWVVGGHSWGAGLALAYALAYPERVRGLVYISGTGITNGWHEEYRRNRRSRLAPQEQERWLWLRAQLRGDNPLDPVQRHALNQEYAHLYRCTDFAHRHNVPLPAEDGPENNHEVNALLNAEWERFLAGLDRGCLATLIMPVLVVHGSADPRPAWAAKDLAEALPNAQFVTLPGVGHYAYLEEPHLLVGAVRSYMTRLVIT